MKFSNILAVFAGVASAAPANTERAEAGPSGHEVEIRGFTYGGSGCPAKSVGSQLSTDLTTLTLLYDSFIAQSGEGIKPSEHRKNCQLNVKLKYPHGWQFSVFKADYRGYANIHPKDKGTCKATYYFSGDSKQYSSAVTFHGPYDDNYLKTDQFNLESLVWSPCGAEGMLNINNEVRLTPLDSKRANLLTVDSTDLKFKQICYLQWRKCTK
ncbi:hypothetical protein N657DRAFT_649229 [Parathielavia appendiculata]|uniref:Secreted protein n=1 Tax=Parathielavia appendiculata TaxID=2587402 RepID=A0AAN6TU32_9PEZI|nr:hypothetical protein N657DRAFT_649229 [Parathielavia appendiculata]